MTDIVSEIDRPDGLLPVTAETVGGLASEIKRLRDLIEQQSASLVAKDKEISTLKMALDDGTNGISAACRDAETLAAKDAEIKRLDKCYDLAMKSRLEWRHRAEQAERALADTERTAKHLLIAANEYQGRLAEAVEVVRPFADNMPRISDVERARAFVAQEGK